MLARARGEPPPVVVDPPCCRGCRAVLSGVDELASPQNLQAKLRTSFLMSWSWASSEAGKNSAPSLTVPGVRRPATAGPRFKSHQRYVGGFIRHCDCRMALHGVTLVLKKCQRLLVALVSLALSPALAHAQPAEVVRSGITLRGTVEAVDHTSRTVRIRGEQGNVVTLDVPQASPRFDQVKVGDLVTASYLDVVSVRPKPAGEADVDRSVAPVTTPTSETLPGAVKARQRVTTVTITAWDPGDTRGDVHRTGRDHLHASSARPDVALMQGLKVGDRADVTRTESISLSVSEPALLQATTPGAAPAAAPAADDFKHRLTISALFGVDNSFAGNMIKASTGTTTGARRST